MNLLNILLVFILILFFIILIIHLIYFQFNNSNCVNLKKNRKLDNIYFINCIENEIKKNKLKTISLVFSKTRFTKNIDNFIVHYDFFMEDINNNKYLIYTVTKKTRDLFIRCLNEKEMKQLNKNNSIYVNNENFIVNSKKYHIDISMENFIDIYKINDCGYHIFYLNCQHKSKNLINLLTNKKYFKIKKYTLEYCIKKILNIKL